MKNIMYHGSYIDFNIFKPSMKTDGIYFASDPNYAAGYANIKASLFNGIPLLYTVSLTITNPYEINGEDESVYRKYVRRGYNVYDLQKNGYDGIIMSFSDAETEAMVINSGQIKIIKKSLLKG